VSEESARYGKDEVARSARLQQPRTYQIHASTPSLCLTTSPRSSQSSSFISIVLSFSCFVKDAERGFRDKAMTSEKAGLERH